MPNFAKSFVANHVHLDGRLLKQSEKWSRLKPHVSPAGGWLFRPWFVYALFALTCTVQAQNPVTAEGEKESAGAGERSEAWFYSQRTYPLGVFPRNALRDAHRIMTAQEKEARAQRIAKTE